ncbi:MAG TPA: hypothetical protein VFC23_21055, partial [Thermoanaerobaculia bacterium]|nr:hypothetical protein [Thermoanaerobaculia bacterium]
AMHNFRDMAAAFDGAGAWRRVADARELAAAWSEWLGDAGAARETGGRGLRLVAENQGALARTLAMLAPLIPSPPGPLATEPPSFSASSPETPAPPARRRGAGRRRR